MDLNKPVATVKAVGKALWYCVLVILGKTKPGDLT